MFALSLAQSGLPQNGTVGKKYAPHFLHLLASNWGLSAGHVNRPPISGTCCFAMLRSPFCVCDQSWATLETDECAPSIYTPISCATKRLWNCASPQASSETLERLEYNGKSWCSQK